MESEKVYCDNGATTALLANAMKGESISPGEMMAMMNNGGLGGNNFLLVLLFFLLYGGNGFGRNNGQGIQDAETMSKLNAISAQIAGNQNSNLVMDAIKGNQSDIGDLATAFNVSSNAMQSAIAKLNGNVGFTGEKVINAGIIGNKDLTSAIQSCCCTTQQNITKMGYENQIATINQTSALQGRIDQLANGVQQGFASIGYQMATDKCDIINAGNANTQRIVDTLNGHWNLELSQKLQDVKNELSQERQTSFLISQLKTTTATATA